MAKSEVNGLLSAARCYLERARVAIACRIAGMIAWFDSKGFALRDESLMLVRIVSREVLAFASEPA